MQEHIGERNMPMKFYIEIEAETTQDLIEKIKEFCRKNSPILEAETVKAEDTPAPKKENKRSKPKSEVKIECRDKPLTEAEVRSAMIDFVNVAAEKQPDLSRKEIFKALLDTFKVDKLADLPEDKYQEMVELVATTKAAL
jgi:hypothetical protein